MDELLHQARAHASADRNRESADAFARVLERAPQRRAELLPEYADQLTYSERAAQAVPLYREALAGVPEGEPRQRLRKGLALALLWSGQHLAAREAYEDVLERSPGDRDAQRNLARALAWGGQPQAAVQRLRELLRTEADDREARLLLAQTQKDMGEADAARETLSHASLAQDEAAVRLRRELEGAQAQPASDAPAIERLVEQARDAARSDRNREAAGLFAQALARAPQRRREWLLDYAEQLTYSERARQAVPLYREALGGELGAEQRQRALRGLGLALLWSDRPSAAREAYEELLRLAPGDVDARRQLAQALSWSGRQRASAAVLEGVLRENPQDAQARAQLAQSQLWLGRPDAAARALAQPGLDSDARVLALRRDIAQAVAPRTSAETQRSTQSDDLDIDSLRLAHEVPLAQGRGAAGLRLARTEFEREDGSDAVRLTRPSAFGRWRFNDAFELNAELGVERIEPRATDGIDKWVYATWLTWWPSDLVRMDFSSSRVSFDNLRSLRLGLTAIQNGVSMDLTPDERQRYNVKIERGLYSDGNRRWTAQASGEWRWRPKPEVWLGLRHGRSEFAQRLDNGYFNPDRVRVTQGTLRVNHRFAGDGPWDLSAFLALGREQAVPDGSKPAWDASLALGRRLGPDTRLEARLQRFSSRTGTAAGVSGFERTTAGLRLEHRW
ncbi:tetratricopeptide repeat protein [Ramlibacter rhizophilus]|uniref:tetratricopeptide repeat protein n=1 Tax=Ramlibacter rhizophilus TaxID=1781167 RepID=UPI0014322FC9|nr:tetratricopeptide repeat protein [Ramlibacter rhizophilus]